MLYILFKQVHDNVVVANLRVRPFQMRVLGRRTGLPLQTDLIERGFDRFNESTGFYLMPQKKTLQI